MQQHPAVTLQWLPAINIWHAPAPCHTSHLAATPCSGTSIQSSKAHGHRGLAEDTLQRQHPGSNAHTFTSSYTSSKNPSSSRYISTKRLTCIPFYGICSNMSALQFQDQLFLAKPTRSAPKARRQEVLKSSAGACPDFKKPI